MMMYSSVKLELLVLGTPAPSREGSGGETVVVGDDMASAAADRNFRFR